MEKVGDYDKGFIDFAQIEDIVQELLFQSQLFAHQFGNFKEDRKAIVEVELTLKALDEDLKQPWNDERTRHNLYIEEFEPSKVTEIVDASRESEVLNMETSEPATPVQRKKVRFVCLTPKTDLMPLYKCHLCQKIFGWLKVLRKHLKMKHDGAEAPGEMKEKEDKVRCRLCNKRINRDLLTRHLTTVHNVKKSGKRKGPTARDYVAY